MSLRGTFSNIVAALAEFDWRMTEGYPEYTTILSLAEYNKVDLIFQQCFAKFLTKTLDALVFSEGPIGTFPLDYTSAIDVENNWSLVIQNKYAKNHIKISCLGEMQNYFFVQSAKNNFKHFCSKIYDNLNDPEFRGDLTDYLYMIYPDHTLEEIGKIISENEARDL